jgi:hypothetical protein
MPLEDDSDADQLLYLCQEIAALGLHEEALSHIRRAAALLETGIFLKPDDFPAEMKEGVKKIFDEFFTEYGERRTV